MAGRKRKWKNGKKLFTFGCCRRWMLVMDDLIVDEGCETKKNLIALLNEQKNLKKIDKDTYQNMNPYLNDHIYRIVKNEYYSWEEMPKFKYAMNYSPLPLYINYRRN